MKKNEKVLVVSRDILFREGNWQGLKTEGTDYYLDLIRKNFQFKLRSKVENDPSWKQIIPYILFNFKDKYFLYRYLSKAGEDRLKNDYHLGIAGHINPFDSDSLKDVLEVGAEREWNEEVDYKGKILKKRLIGILNDERREVEKVHLGLIFIYEGDTPDILIKEREVLKGGMVKLKDLGEYVQDVSNWAQIIYKDYLNKKIYDVV